MEVGDRCWTALHDQGRIRALLDSGLMSTACEPVFERQTWLASKALRAPIAFISLLDDQRELFKSAVGLPAAWSQTLQIPLQESLSLQVVAFDRPVAVSDVREHAALGASSAASTLSAIAYAAVPLTTTAGHTLGALSVVDTRPRAWSGDDVRALRELAATVMSEIELRAAALDLSAPPRALASSHGLVRNAFVERDVNEQRGVQERLQRMIESLRLLAVMDELTGLHNRRGFMALAEHQIKLAERQGFPMLVFFADLDDLKTINDTLGHEAGDQALRDTAAVLRVTFRESDVLARLGGDEFVVLACNANIGDADLFAARLHAALDAYNALPDRRFPLWISTGATMFDPRAPESLGTLLRHADAAMYAHKRKRVEEREGAVPVGGKV